MIKLSRGDINSTELEGALRKLVSYTKFPVKTAYRIGRMGQRINQEMDAVRSGYQKLVQAHVKEDDNARAKVKKDNTFDFIDDEHRKKFDEGFKKLIEVDFEIKALKIPVADLDGVGLTPKELTFMDKLVDFGDGPITRKLTLEKGGGDGEEKKESDKGENKESKSEDKKEEKGKEVS